MCFEKLLGSCSNFFIVEIVYKQNRIFCTDRERAVNL